MRRLRSSCAVFWLAFSSLCGACISAGFAGEGAALSPYFVPPRAPIAPRQPRAVPAASAVVPSFAGAQIIDLTTALRLAENENPRLGLSREAVREALALYQGAKVLLLPDLNAGTNYHLHNGPLQTSFGLIRTLDEQSIYAGGGARALAAETVGIPMVRIFGHLGDAIFLPLAAQQELSARSSEANATETLVLYDVATGYLQLAANEARIEAWQQSQAEAAEIARITADFARIGQGRDGDYKRALSDTLLLRVDQQGSEADASVASNELARLLRLDPSLRLTTARAPMETVVLVSPQASVEELVDLASRKRWELAAQSAQIAAAQQRYRLEATRPLFPLISIGYSAGGFGGGSNETSLGVPSLLQVFSGRDDFDVMAVWTLQNMGAGNVALARQRRVERDTLFSRRVMMNTQVRREVTAAYAEVQAAQRRISAAALQLAIAQQGAAREIARTRGGQGLPIESLNSVMLLAQARQDAITAVLLFDIAEFRLFAAIGENPDSRTTDPLPTQPSAEPIARPSAAIEHLPSP